MLKKTGIHNNTYGMRSMLVFLLVLANFGMLAQNTRKGYKLLEKSEYDKAYEVFSEVRDEFADNPAANFGLALILADEKSTRFDLIHAWGFAVTTQKNLDELTPDELEYIGEYFLNTEIRSMNRPVRKKMEYALATLEAKLIKYVREENNLEIVYAVLDKYPDFRYHDNVIHIRNHLEFRKYEKQNTLAAYQEFLQKFPDAAQVEEARHYISRLAFEQARQINTVEGYSEYIKNYPQAADYSQAIKLLYAAAFEKAKKQNTIAAFDEFLANYPDALETAEARTIQKQLLYEYARKIQTLEAYNEFIRKYPDGQQYVDIFNLKSLDRGMQFLGQYPVASNNIQWARHFDDEGNNELSATLAVDTSNIYLVGGTVFRADTGSTDAWVIKTGTDGKMIWNKFVGEEFNDELEFLEVNSVNEILGIGHTWSGIDSTSRESWIFKLGQTGQKIWSRKLGAIQIKSLHMSPQGSLFLGGYMKTDSLARYAVIALNEKGKRLWSRTYTGEGSINGITGLPDGRIILGGSRWRAKIDPRGYLLWESALGPADSILSCFTLPRGEILYLGIRNNQKSMMVKTGPDNKTILEKELNLTAVPQAILSILQGSQNQVLVLADQGTYKTLFWLNTSNGEVSLVNLPPEINATAIRKDHQGNLLISAHSGGILLLKNSGITF